MADVQLIRSQFVIYSISRLRDSQTQIERCLELLSEEQLWTRFNEVSNAIGNLVLHLTGNVRQWIIGGVAGETVDRDRPAEFSQREPLPVEQLAGPLCTTLDEACRIIDQISADRLVEMVEIQGYEVSVLSAVYHVVEHFSLHTGQIVYATKILTNRDLSLYDAHGRRLDERVSGTP